MLVLVPCRLTGNVDIGGLSGRIAGGVLNEMDFVNVFLWSAMTALIDRQHVCVCGLADSVTEGGNVFTHHAVALIKYLFASRTAANICDVLHKGSGFLV